MDFNVTVVVIPKDENLPPLNEVFNALLDDRSIPVVFIQDSNHKLWKKLLKARPSDVEFKYVIITIKYSKNFEA